MRKFLTSSLIVLLIVAALLLAWWKSPLHQVRTLTTSVIIYAPPDRVWQVLTDFHSYPQWNPFIKQATGTPRTGERLELTMQLGDSTMNFRPKVLDAELEHELRWRGQFVLPGLMDGEHSFVLEREGNNTRLTQSESFDGLLVVPMWRSMAPATLEGFRQMNQAMKERAETR